MYRNGVCRREEGAVEAVSRLGWHGTAGCLADGQANGLAGDRFEWKIVGRARLCVVSIAGRGWRTAVVGERRPLRRRISNRKEEIAGSGPQASGTRTTVRGLEARETEIRHTATHCHPRPHPAKAGGTEEGSTTAGGADSLLQSSVPRLRPLPRSGLLSLRPRTRGPQAQAQDGCM